jgi:Zn-dependent metalloprotease
MKPICRCASSNVQPVSPRFHALHCVVPPVMLENIVRNGSPEQRDWALHNLELSGQFRGHRQAAAQAIQSATPAGEKRRTIYDARNTEKLPGKLVRSEGDPRSKDVAVNEAYAGSGATYDFFAKVFRRNSIDDRGLRLDSTVHYGEDYDNAFWNGRQMVYGDGDGELFNRFTIALDVIGHELTHGITEYEAALVYRDESGALNESLSDVFGCLVKQYRRSQKTRAADWLVGRGLLTRGVKGVALRSMKAPGTAYDDPVLGQDPQPDHRRNLYKGRKDNGGVHINSGIPNKAFYLSAIALSPNGYAWHKAGPIWYETLCNRLRPESDFAECARLTRLVAKEMFGTAAKAAVDRAWKAVGY